MACAHEEFESVIKVGRLTEVEGGPVTNYLAELRIRCAQCKTQFLFNGLQPGFDVAGATVSIDGEEANLAIFPKGARPSPLQRLGFSVSAREFN